MVSYKIYINYDEQYADMYVDDELIVEHGALMGYCG